MSGDLKEIYDRGLDLFDKGKYIEAEGLLKEVVKENPNYADILNKLGVIANLAGRLDEASYYFERAVALNPAYTEAVLNLTITYNEMGETEKAGKFFHDSTRRAAQQPGTLDPFVAGKLANEHFRLGNIYLDFGLGDEAIHELRKALKLRPGFPDIRTRLGIALRERKRFDEAISQFTKAKEANPLYGPALVQLGLTYYMQGLTGLAFEEWEDAQRKLPDLKEARSLLNIFKHRE
jgi:tetratricopeptide (TPR) repeat protein